MADLITLLAIETSCDETGVALVQKKGDQVTVLSQAVASQVDIHAVTQGVVPEVAAREHVTVLRPLIHEVLRNGGVTGPELSAIAVTVGPGLQPALAVGVNAAKTLAYTWAKPIVPVHHLEGHIYSALLQGTSQFPALALIVSGGHTMLVKISEHIQYEILGSTRDDAVGEAFDKVARMLELPYPGGPQISRLAAQGNRHAFVLPHPMVNSGDLDFSFSGLKTAVLYAIRDLPAAQRKQAEADIAASFEEAAVQTLITKTKQAIKKVTPAVLLLAGGVAANQHLRQALQQVAEAEHLPLYIAPLALCGDNGVMIGQAAAFAYEQGRIMEWSEIDAWARLKLDDFSQLSRVRQVVAPHVVA